MNKLNRLLIFCVVFTFALCHFVTQPALSAAEGSLFASTDWDFGGEISTNYRGIESTPAEVEIENQLYISDVYFSLSKHLKKQFPFEMEFTTDLDGKPVLNQFNLHNFTAEGLQITFGKFLVPFGHYNEIYKPSDFLSITRPLPYASPKSLDYVSRINYAHPIMASGFSSLGVLGTWLNPGPTRVYLPSRLDLYIINGLGENPLLGRGFPRAELLGVPNQQGGVFVDYGHERSSLADNNDSKTIGARVRFALGDLRAPFFAEGKELKGAQLGFSAMGGKYDLEDLLDHYAFGAEFVFQLDRYHVTTEYLYSPQEYRVSQSTQTADLNTSALPKHRESLRGFYISNAFRLPHWFYGQESFAYLGYSLMTRLGDQFEFDEVKKITYQPLNNPGVKKTMEKYTIGVRSKIEENFHFKVEYSLWDLNNPDTRIADGANIDQIAISGVITF